MGDVKVPKVMKKPPQAADFKLPTWRIKYRGTFNFTKLYNYVWTWFTYHKYVTWEKMHKFKPPEFEVNIGGKRKISSYLRYAPEIHIHMFFDERIPTMIDGKPAELVTARITITLTGEVLTGYADQLKHSFWEESWFTKKLKAMINNTIMNENYNALDWDVLYYEMMGMHTELKKIMNFTAKGGAY
jgi:hypothetical protein